MGSTSLFNVRVGDELEDAIEAAAQREGLKKSTWAREVLAVAAMAGVSLEELAALVAAKGASGMSPHPDRYLPLQGRVGRQERVQAGCVHPVTARKQMPFSVLCGVCGATVKRA